jgi:hypothetical protein
MTVSETSSDNDALQAGEWCDIHTAALRLGVTDRTLYRRVKTGKLAKRERPDGRTEVWLTVTERHDTVSDTVGHTEEIQAGRALAITQRFNDAVSLAVSQQLAVHVDKIAELAEENGRLKRIIAELTERPTMSETKSDTVSEPPVTLETPQQPATRPWWRFWG